MSRTVKGRKGPGYEYWGRRRPPMGQPGRWTKTLTHRLERRVEAKQQIEEQVRDLPSQEGPMRAEPTR